MGQIDWINWKVVKYKIMEFRLPGVLSRAPQIMLRSEYNAVL